MTTFRRRRKSACFTLIEMLVVVALIFILAALLMPALQSALMQGRQTSCLGNERQMGMVLAAYGNDNNDYIVNNDELGTTRRWYANLPQQGYLPDSNLFFCGANTQQYKQYIGGVPYGTTYGINTFVSGFSIPNTWAQLRNWKFAELAGSRLGLTRTPVFTDSCGTYFIHLTFYPNGDPFGTAAPANISALHLGGTNVLFADLHARNIKAPFGDPGQYIYWLQPNCSIDPSYIRY